jgi:Cu/Ag efflux protein CusF
MIRRSQINVVMAALIVVLSAGQLFAQAGAQTPPGVQGKPITATATIEAIDRSTRQITLKNPKGEMTTIVAGPEVKRFDELKVGDTVSATYYESVAVNVRRPGDPGPNPGGAAITPGTGAKPGATAAVQQSVTVVVQSIDKANQSVTVKRTDGSIVSFRVQNPKYLEMAKAGDTVDITYTQAVLVEVVPSKK